VDAPALEIGVSLATGPQLVTFAKAAEAAGFDYLSCGEHLAFHGPTTNAFIALSAAAGATSTIRLVSAITLLPLYPAALAAKLAATLDVVSAGRFNLGVGIGGEFPKEFEAVGIDVAERAARTDEALEVIHVLLTQERASFEGRFTSFSELTIAPRPVQRPRMPIWVAGRRHGAMRRALRHGDVWMPYLYTPERLADSLETIHGLAREHGADGWPGRAAVYAFTTVYADGDEARRVAARRVGTTYQQDFSQLADSYLVAGTPEECVGRLRQYIRAGAQILLLRLACPERDALQMMELVAREVVPALRA
jgi:probable F420-dependent oxidoreductase